eukprot:9006112-Pyramimonas_sp.AAC.1
MFSGTGELSRHLRARGEAVIEGDVRYGECFNLLVPGVWHVLRGWITRQRVKAAWLGTMWRLFQGPPCPFIQ